MHFHQIQMLVQDWGILGAFLVMVVENLGIPFPTEVGFLVTQSLIEDHAILYPVAVAILTLGHITGSVIAYAIGRWGDKSLMNWLEKHSRMHASKQRLEIWYEKWGAWTVFISRIFGYIRPWASLVAGFAKVDFMTFLLWTSVGSLVFTVGSLYLTRYIIRYWIAYPQFHGAMLIVLFFIFFGAILFELGRQLYGRIRRK